MQEAPANSVFIRLISDPDGQLNEMSLVALLLGLTSVLALLIMAVVFAITAIFAAIKSLPIGPAFHEFADSCSILIGATGTSLGAFAGFIGMRAKQERGT